MEIKLVSDNQNPLLQRREVKFEVSHPSAPTPSTKELRAKLAAKLTAKDDLLIVKNCQTIYGGTVTKGQANVYKNKEAMKVELPQYIKRNFPPVEEKPAEPKPEEKPAEEKPEEKKEAPNVEEKKEEPKKEAPKAEPKPEAKPEEKKEESK